MSTTVAIQVRQATRGDAEIVAQFNELMAMETESRRLDPVTIRAGVSAALEDATRGVYFLAESGGQVVGQLLVTLEWSDWRSGWFWWIQSVFVRESDRRAGVYRMLHEHVRAEAMRRGDVRGIRLYVDHENAHAQEVYRRMGMVKTHYHLYEEDWSGVEKRE